MNCINTNSNNINFTAKMNILAADVDIKRLNNIAEMFERKTNEFPHDTFEVNGTKQNGYQIYHFDKNCNEENCCDITTEQWQKLFEKSNEYVNGKLVKLFNIFKKKDEDIHAASKYISTVMENDKNGDPTDFEQKFWDIVYEKVTNDRNIAVSKDSILKDFEIY